MTDDTDDICGAETADGSPCQHPAGDDGRCWVPSHQPGGGENVGPSAPGRPSKFTPEKGREACEMAHHGASLEGCGRAAGVSRSTLMDWLKKHEDFRTDFMRARARGEQKRLREDSQHARFLLARSYGYEETQRVDATSDGDKIDGGVIVLPDNGSEEGGSDG